ncbi:MAG: NADH-quinone oxidoreductase subunit L, partial [Candidatus Acidiferrales bacterium]
MLDLVWLLPLVPLLPLAGAALLGLRGRQWSHGNVNVVGVGSAGLSLGAAIAAAVAFFQLPLTDIPWKHDYFTWLQAGSFQVQASFYFDQLSLLMMLVVTGVGFLIHVYSIGYMHHEGGYYRFFAYLNLFMFFML